MTKVEYTEYRSSVSNLSGDLEVSIPFKIHRPLVICFIVMLAIALDVVFNQYQALNEARFDALSFYLFDMVMLLVFAFFCVSLLMGLFVSVKGEYIVSVTDDELTYKIKCLFFSSFSKSYELSQITNFRSRPMKDTEATDDVDYDCCSIAFDYGAKSHSFGHGLDEAEANYIIGLIRSRKTPIQG